MVHQLVVLGVGVALGLSILGIALLAEAVRESQRTPNRPYSQRRSKSPNRYPNSAPSSNINRPTNTQPRRRPDVESRATSTTSPTLASRATSPPPGRHFADNCRVCGDSRVVAFRPCGDYIFCSSCAEEYEGQDCPMCYARIQSIS